MGWRRGSNNIPYLRMELRCVIAIIRHGDRTPKQKMKMEVTHPRQEGCPNLDRQVFVREMGMGQLPEVLTVSPHTEAFPYFFRFFSLFEKHGGYKTGKLKLKRPEQLQVTW